MVSKKNMIYRHWGFKFALEYAIRKGHEKPGGTEIEWDTSAVEFIGPLPCKLCSGMSGKFRACMQDR
jgi:hypothetical protein